MTNKLVGVQIKPFYRHAGKWVKILQEFIESDKSLVMVEGGEYGQLRQAAMTHGLPVRVQMINGQTYLEKKEERENDQV